MKDVERHALKFFSNFSDTWNPFKNEVKCQKMIFSILFNTRISYDKSFMVTNERRGQETCPRILSDFLDTRNSFKSEVKCQKIIFSILFNTRKAYGQNFMVANGRRGQKTYASMFSNFFSSFFQIYEIVCDWPVCSIWGDFLTEIRYCYIRFIIKSLNHGFVSIRTGSEAK